MLRVDSKNNDWNTPAYALSQVLSLPGSPHRQREKKKCMKRTLIFAAALASFHTGYAQTPAPKPVDTDVQVVIYVDLDPALTVRGIALLTQEKPRGDCIGRVPQRGARG